MPLNVHTALRCNPHILRHLDARKAWGINQKRWCSVVKKEEGLEPAVKSDPPFKLDKRVYNIAVSSLLNGSGIGVIIPVMPLFANSIGISPAGLGMVVAVMGAARLVCNIPAAWAADRYGRKPLMVAGPGVSAAGTGFCAIASSLPELLVFRVMSGFGGSLQMTGGQLYLADISTPETRARTMAPLAAAFSLGMMVGPMVGGIIAGSHGLAAPFYYVGVAMMFSSINNMVMLPESRPPEVKEVKRRPLKEEVMATIQSWRPITSSPSMRAVLALHSAYWGITSGAMFTLLPLFAAEQFGATAMEIGKCFTALAMINLVGSQPVAWVSDKYGRKAVAVPGVMVMAVASFCLPLAATREQLGMLWMAWGCGATMLGTSPTAYTSDINSESTRSQALALLRSAGDVGLMLGAGVIGIIAKMFGITTGFWTSSALLVVVGLNFAFRANETVGKWKTSL
eukprot:TRINITY_DN9532_c0_g1_i2.p1 TRINITY_DN9532_c0_g1~~TRINITY_DN9532_c0_g1_i2.p1  ORF type:complete len:454 (+),score=73.02 TRINITY_DN9532_c0_g1_i2:56-1417(+)